jgi:hypothetical protein
MPELARPTFRCASASDFAPAHGRVLDTGMNGSPAASQGFTLPRVVSVDTSARSPSEDVADDKS